MWETERDEGASGVYPGEAQLLYGLVRALRPSAILEVGTSHGYSTLHLAQACKDNEYGFVCSVEIDDKRRGDAVYNLEKAGLSGYCVLYKELDRMDFNRFDLAFLDAGHTEDDLRQYLPYSNSAKVIVVHDAMWQNHVREVMSEDYNIMIFENTSHAGIAICQKR